MPLRAVVAVCAAILLSVDGLAAQQQRAARRTWVIPHVLEKAGRITNTTHTFDTDIHILNLDRRATVEVSVFGDDGQPMRSRSGQAVCNPCSITFAGSPKQVFSLEERIVAAGGFAREVMTGYIVISTTGPAQVNLQGFVVNSHTSAFDLSVFGFEPQPLAAEAQ